MAAEAGEQPIEILVDALWMQQLVERPLDAQLEVPLQFGRTGPEAGPAQQERHAVACLSIGHRPLRSRQ